MADDSLQCLRVVVRGHVQGVGYRFSCVQQARSLGVAGWVRNCRDGSVEAFLQGPQPRVRQMCDWMRQHVPGASVQSLEATPQPPQPGLRGFEQRPTA